MAALKHVAIPFVLLTTTLIFKASAETFHTAQVGTPPGGGQLLQFSNTPVRQI